MKAFFSGDVHGATLVWRKWIKVAEIYKPDVLMFCGDLTGKALYPFVKQKDGSYHVRYSTKLYKLRGEDEVRKMEERISSFGDYTIRITPEEVKELQDNPKKVSELILNAQKERMKEWLDFLVQKVDVKRIKTIVMPGNDDCFEIDPIIKSYEDKGVIYPLNKVVNLDDFEVISLDYTNPTPWGTPREASEKELEKKIEKLVEKLSNPSTSIFNFHCPPYNTRLDRAPLLTRDFRFKTTMGAVDFTHVGSIAVRKAIERYQPLIGLHSHIHESYAIDKLGNTTVVNPGSEYDKGILRGFILEFSEKKLEKYWRIEG